MTSIQMSYLGFATVDKRLSNPMLPWIIAQIRRGGNSYKVGVSLDKCCLEIRGLEKKLSHQLSLVARLGVYPEGEGGYLIYALRDREQPLLYCHLLWSADIHDVLDLMASMKEQSYRVKTPMTLCPDISPSSSHFFEVLYIGRIKVSHKKVPDNFIDEALDKFKIFEKQRKEKEILAQDGLKLNGIDKKTSIAYSSSTETLPSDESSHEKTEKEVVVRHRSGSLGTVIPLFKKQESLGSKENVNHEHNRTMVFHVGRSDLRLISPDRKQILLHKYLRDITSTLQGSRHSSHLAFIAKEPSSTDNNSNYVGYVFKCESPSVAEDIVSAISQASVSEKKTSVASCDTCPMVWYHRVCTEIDQAGPNGGREALMKRLDSLPQEEAAVVKTKLEGGGVGSAESLEITMMLLRAHCEAKQARHIHDTIETRHEFLSHYLGGNAIFMKAKRSLTSSFDQLLKRKTSKDEIGHSLSLPNNATMKDLGVDTPVKSISEIDSSEEPATPGSMKNIFMKLGKSTPKTPQDDLRPRSWRQAIFNNVVTPSKALQKESESKRQRRDRNFYKNLWKKAINQQVLLIRMEKENAQLTARQEEATLKRIKLEYDEIGSTKPLDIWDAIFESNKVLDEAQKNDALNNGIPKSRRGEVWLYFADTYVSKSDYEVDYSQFPNYDVPYEDLLKQLTSHQHAILIDLGRTFPNHPFYSSPLGPGQLSLFNILKAYSLLDPTVGYCQGLSFTAGVLLLHMPEADAFYLLRHLMFCRGLRERYLPDMSALQVCLYQLSRLLHDLHPDLYSHFDSLDIAPSLYAAPWLLTIFSSQFSLGFVARIFDLMFGDSPQVLFKVAIALLGLHKQELLSCETFEDVMDYLKVKLPHVTNETMDVILHEVLTTDVSRELKDYGVEYHVLEEEMSSPRPEFKRVKELENSNQGLMEQINTLNKQLQMSISDKKRLEHSRTEYMSQLNRLEQENKELKDDLKLLSTYIVDEINSNDLPPNIFRVLKKLNMKLQNKNKVELKAKSSCPEITVGADKAASTAVGRVLTESERKALVESRQNALERAKVKLTQSAYDVRSGKHPLDNDSVPTSFEGTVCLKSIPVPLRRCETITTPPTERSHSLNLRRAETAELRIVESNDIVSRKIQSTKDKVSRLFEFEKPFGKETEMLIKSQAMHKSSGLLT